MTADLLLCLSIPAAYLAASAALRLNRAITGRKAASIAGLAAGVVFAIAVTLAALTAIKGASTVTLFSWGSAAPGFRLDVISLSILVLVTFVGFVVTRFSRNYLDGDTRQTLFFSRLMAALAVTTVLTLAGDLIVFAAGWIVLLLVFYPDRPVAVLAARKKFIAARLGDACIVTAFGLLWTAAGTTDIVTITARAAESGLGGYSLPAALLIANAALMKSAQFPFHGWITEVMETPTPVSALLHAGIVNAGGFAVLRFSGLIASEETALWLLALVGGGTAFVASIVMLTESRIKTQLAWSTIAQMGFMMLQCGLGAFSSALLHILAHSLYKAHAFLWAGAAVEAQKDAGLQPAVRSPLAAALGACAAALVIFAATGAAFAGGLWEKPALSVLGSIVVLGMGQMAASALAAGGGGRLLARLGVAMIAISAIYFALQLSLDWLTAGALAEAPAPGLAMIAILALTFLSFAALSLLQARQLHLDPPQWTERLRIHAGNGFYANAAFNRLCGALRIHNSSI
jgi:NAD(P)H-quinone oxidoreductase subunit 5